jgi:uncharacterized repeat protein (TIGR01451 family)
MKRSIFGTPIFGTLALVLLACLYTFGEARAVQIDAFTFFIPYPADALDDQFDAANYDDFRGVSIVTTVSISVLRGGSIVYYDHWEDGLEPNITQPIQPTTQVWGDDNLANGIPPGFSSDVLNAGDVIAVQNTVEVEPRDPAVVLYDGGDKLFSSGGAIAVALAVWPETVQSEDGSLIPGILFAGAWELYPTSRWGSAYIMPVGQDVERGAGSFDVVGLNVQAVQDGTSVQVDLDADGDFEITQLLDEGGQLTEVRGVNAGAQVQASAPVQVNLFTGNPAADYEARAYTMLPTDQWMNEYLAPRSSDGDYWIYNPHDSELVVSADTITDTVVITISANGVAKFPPLGLSTATGVHFTAADDFYGLAALDEADDQDWGYALLPIENLTAQVLIGWAPGNINNPPDGDESRVYVTAVETTTVTVDYDGDRSPDAQYQVAPLAEVDITDPIDHDMTGAYLYVENGTPFIPVWGQDESAPPALPSIDVGTKIVPLRAHSIQQESELLTEGYVCGTLVQPYTLEFLLHVYNDSVADSPEVIVADYLPSEFSYVLGSTRVGGGAIKDDSIGSPFPLDEGGYNIGTIPGFGETPITFRTVTTYTGEFVNRAEILSPRADPAIATIRLPARVAGYAMTKFSIDPADGVVDPEPGQVITFGLTITNTGEETITQLPVWDTFDESLLSFQGATVLPEEVASGVITWTDLTIPFGDLAPAQSITQSMSFSVTYPIPAGVSGTSNVVLGEAVQDALGRTQAITCSVASVSFVIPTPTPPTITPSPTPSPTVTPTLPPVTKTSTPPSVTQTPRPAPGLTPTPTQFRPTPGIITLVTPTPAVVLLPETGAGRPPSVQRWLWLALPILGLLAAWVFRPRSR